MLATPSVVPTHAEASQSHRPVAVLGAGAWGTTLALMLARADRSVRLWAHHPDHATALQATRQNERYLPGHTLPPQILITSDLGVAVTGAGLVLLVVPSAAVRTTARQLRHWLPPAVPVVNCAKGLEEASNQRLSRVIVAEIPELADHIGVLSGPNLAAEIVAGRPATSVVATINPAVAVTARGYLMTPTLRIYTSDDLVGVELCGALKNVIALGAGISDGLGMGDNAKAAFLTRGLAEMLRLGVAAGARPLTFAGLAGIGDLIATCASPLSRNRRVGERLARGQSLSTIMAELGHVAEGVATTRAASRLAAELGVTMPITEQLNLILFEGKPVERAIQDLMAREPRPELDEPLFTTS